MDLDAGLKMLPELASERGAKAPVVCLELNPPRDEMGRANIRALVARVGKWTDFLTMTDTGVARGQGALEAAIRLRREFPLPVVAHLACAGRSRDELLRDAEALIESGIAHVLVLRGDPPHGASVFRPHESGFAHADEAIRALRARGFPLVIGAACYPGGHPEDRDPRQDLAAMQRKRGAGADFFITQAVFNPSVDWYRRYVEEMLPATRGDSLRPPAPILPCCLAVHVLERLQKIATRCDVEIPQDLLAELVNMGDATVLQQMAGLARGAWFQGAPGIHLCTFNNPDLTERFLEELFDQHGSRGRPVRLGSSSRPSFCLN